MKVSTPIIHVKPGEMDGAVLDGLQIVIDPPGSAPNGILIHGGAKNLTIQNCEIVGAGRMGIDVSAGANPGLKLLNNEVHDCTPVVPGDCSGIYTEGLTGARIAGNLVYNNGWWKGYDPTNTADNAQAGRNHGHYSNESSGTDDSNVWDSNLFLDNLGSQIGSRCGGTFVGNVLRTSFDWALIVGQFGKLAFIGGNAIFGPKADAPPNWGSGIKLLCPGYCGMNLVCGDAGDTLNPVAIDATGKIVWQIGYWPKAGATDAPAPPAKVPTLEDFCVATYGKADVTLLQPGDAPKVVTWLAQQLVNPPQPPAPPPPALTGSVSIGGKTYQVTGR